MIWLSGWGFSVERPSNREQQSDAAAELIVGIVQGWMVSGWADALSPLQKLIRLLAASQRLRLAQHAQRFSIQIEVGPFIRREPFG